MHRIGREEFLEMLRKVEHGLSSRDFLAQSTCFVFDSGFIITFNEEISVRLKTNFPDEFHGAVCAQPLLNALEAITDETVDLSVSNGKFYVSANRKKVHVRMESEIQLPIDHVECPDKTAWVDLPEDFARAVEQTVPAAGTNKEEFIMTCVHIHPDHMEAADRKSVASRYNIKTGVSRPFLVAATSLKPVVSLGLTRMAETDNWIHFRNKTMFFSCRRHMDAYPNYAPIYEFRGEQITLPRGALEASKIAGIFSSDDKDNDKVDVLLADGKMVITGEGLHGGASIELEMSYRSTPLEFRISPVVLERLIENYMECEIGTGKLMVSGEQWKFFTLLSQPSNKSPIPIPTEDSNGTDDAETDPDSDGD